MTNVIIAVVTEDALKYLPQMWGGLLDHQPILSFKIGEGGWIDKGSGPEPRTPDPTLRRLSDDIQDLDAIVDPTRAVADQRYPFDSLYTFSKTFVSGDVSWQSPSAIRCRCVLDLTEANDDGFGNNPEFNEIGIYSNHPEFPGSEELMVAYGTFATQTKTASRSLENIVVIYFANG